MDESDIISPLWDHIEDLRRTLLSCLAVIFVGMACSFIFYKPLIHWLTAPLNPQGFQRKLDIEEIQHYKISNPHRTPVAYTLPSSAFVISRSGDIKRNDSGEFLLNPGSVMEVGKKRSNRLIFLSPVEGMLATLKICFWVGLAATSPLWMFILLNFIVPGLKASEKKLLAPFVCFTLFFMALGTYFAFYVTIPLANLFFQAFNQEIGTDVWSFNSYLDYSLGILLGNALAFESALMLIFCIHFGIFRSSTLANKRRYAFLAIFILSALLTPPDVFSQLLLAFPLLLLYEAGILYAKFREKKMLKRKSLSSEHSV